MDEDALYAAAIGGDAVAIAKLEMEADRLNEYEETILHIESQNGNTDRVRFILKEFANKNLLIKLDNEKETALTWAAYNGHTEVAELLIDAARHIPPSANDNPVTSFQAFLRQPGESMNTALHAAVITSNVAIVKLLVEADPSDTHIQNKEGKTPMYIAVEQGYEDIVEIICTTCTAPSLDGPDGTAAREIKNLNQGKNPGGTLYGIFYIKDALYEDAIEGDADAIARLEMEADTVNENGETMLHVESHDGSTEHVQFILRQFANKNLLVKQDDKKRTALQRAACYGNFEVVEVLIDAARRLPSCSSANDNPVTSFQAFLRHGDKDMDTALHLAVMYGAVRTTMLLVDADPNDRHIQNNEGESPMYIAVKKGYLDIVKIISTTCTAPSFDGPGGSTALHAAINYLSHGINVAEVVIDAARLLYTSSENENTDGLVGSFQAFLRQGDENGNTALHVAVIQGNLAIAKILVETDPSDRHAQNEEGKTPIYIAAESRHSDILKVMCATCTALSLDGPCPDGGTALHAAIANFYHGIEVIEVLIGVARLLSYSSSSDDDDDDEDQVGAFQTFLRKGDEDLNTALHIAVMQRQLDTAKLLVEADPSDEHIQNKKGKTPMYIAAENGYNDIVKMIGKTCTAPSMDGPGGSTALHAAIKNHNYDIEVVEVLIGAARFLSTSSDNENTKSLVGPVQAFLRQGDEDWNTALHIAVMQRQLDTAKLLVEADPSDGHIQNKKGKTPMYIAAENGYNDIVKMICKTCIAPSLDGPGGSTALHAAIKKLDHAKKEDRDVVRIIVDVVKSAYLPNYYEDLEEFFNKTDEDRCTILELAVERNYVDVVELILQEQSPSFEDRDKPYFLGLLPLYYKAMDKGYQDIAKLLDQSFTTGVKNTVRFKATVHLISAIHDRVTERAITLLDKKAPGLVTFFDNIGWTALHHAAYYEFDSIIRRIIEAQKNWDHSFVYENRVSTPFHVAAEKGYTSTVKLLMQLWPYWSAAYTAADRNGQNILHLAALQSKKEMIRDILNYCSEKYKKEFVNQQDNKGNTPLHILIWRGCLVPELLKYEELDIRVKNKEKWTPTDMLYFEDQVIDDQVQIKFALRDIQIDQKKDIFSSSVPPSKRMRKDVMFKKQAKLMTHEKHARMKEDTHAIASCFADAIAGDAISKAALEMEADTLNEEGKTILHVESMRGDTERVGYIVREFANKNLLGKLDKLKQTALHLAAHHGHTRVVEVLIDAARHLPFSAHNPVSSFQDFIRKATGPMRNTALHLAVLNGNVAIVKLLVEADPNDSHIQNKDGKTPIYIAAENGYKDIVKEICTTCTALSLDGPGGRTTALHALIQNIDQDGGTDVIKMMVNATKSQSSADEISLVNFKALFSRTDELGNTVLKLAMERNNVNAVKVILPEDPTYQHEGEIKRNNVMRLIYKAMDNEYSDDIIGSLCKTYEAGINNPHPEYVIALILAIKKRDEDSVLGLLEVAKHLVTFTEDNGWTALHYAAYHEFDSILDVIIKAQKDAGHSFVYGNMVSTPFHIAVKYGYTSTLVRLMELWPVSSSAIIDGNSPYTAVNKDGRNILHLAAADNRKEMVQGILKYCPEKYKDEILKQQDTDGDTPLHLLISHGCYIPELIKHKGLDTMAKNNNHFTPRDMLYFKNDVVADQVQIKIALDDVQTNQLAWNLWAKNTEKKMDIWESIVPPSKRMTKDVIFNKQAKLMMHEKYARMKEDAHAIANCFADAIAGDAISKAALKMKADTLNESGETILHVESKKGDIENVRFIVREFANKSLLVKRDRLKQTALNLAAHHGHTQVVEILIDAARYLPTSSANDDAHNPISSFQEFIRQAAGPMGNTALHLAVLNYNVAIVQLLVEADPNDSHGQNSDGKTPIYIAAENGYTDIVKEICTTCTDLSLDGPGGRTTALHALIQNISQVKEGTSDVIRMMVDAAKRWSSASLVDFEALFSRTDDSRRTVLQLAVERNYVDAVKWILLEDPAYQHGHEIKRNGLMRLICKAINNEYSDDIVKLLSQTYEAGIKPDHKNVLALILSIQRLDEGSVLQLLGEAKCLVTFTDDNGWTPLHYAAYHEFDSILDAIIKAQKDVGHPFVYGNMVSTPFHVAIKYGYTSTLIRLMELWPSSSSASTAVNSPYTSVNKDGRNILHLAAAADNRKEMVQGILKYCPEKYKDHILKQQDISGDTPLHLLISHGCFIPELIKYEGLDTMAKNKKDFTPRDMLYVDDDIVDDQVHIKIALDYVQTNQSVWKLWGKKSEKKTDIWKCNKTPPSKRKKKDGKFEEGKKDLIDKKHEQRKRDLETYKMRTNTQIIVTALITTVTFTVGFTMPGGLQQSGEVGEGLVVLSRKRAFNVFMVSDALALLMSTSALFFYFLESMNEDPRQVSILNASSTVLNILSVMAMMLTFIAGTYVVLSDSPVLAIAVCIIGSLFFLLIIILWIIKIVYDRQVKKNKD